MNNERDINYLLKKYETKQPGETWTLETEMKYKHEYEYKQRTHTLDRIINERKSKGPFIFTRDEKERAKYLIRKHHLKTPYSEEQIIAMIIVYVKLEFHKSTAVRMYDAILNDYGVSKDTFIRFIVGLNQL